MFEVSSKIALQRRQSLIGWKSEGMEKEVRQAGEGPLEKSKGAVVGLCGCGLIAALRCVDGGSGEINPLYGVTIPRRQNPKYGAETNGNSYPKLATGVCLDLNVVERIF